jgi:hypothetical protein
MLKRLTTFVLAIVAVIACLCACSSRETAGYDETGGTEMISDPNRIDLTKFDEELFKASFWPGNSATPELSGEGVKFIATTTSRDPSVFWNISSMYKAAGYPAQADGKTYVPFSPERRKVIVLKCSAEWGGAFEMFYATGDNENAREGYSLIEKYGGDSEFFGERTTQYLIFEAGKNTPGWKDTFNDSFRLDYTNYVEEGDEFLLQAIAFCKNRAEAEAYVASDKGKADPNPKVEKGYYVCLYEDRLGEPEGNIDGSVYSKLKDAKAACDSLKEYGYRVANESGKIVYLPYTLLQCNLLREAHYITEYARTHDFKYGDSCTNPGINHRPLRTSCDRLVDWILYRAGFTDQPLVQGCVVSNLVNWCEKKGFKKITDVNELRAGDIIFVRPAADGGPQHVFMLASEVKDGMALRYDHGSDRRIVSSQPFHEPLSYEDAPFMYAYRPVANKDNNIYGAI